MKDTKQNANNNTNTTVIQVNGDYYSGITESQAKEIALATVRNEFSILYGEAKIYLKSVFKKSSMNHYLEYNMIALNRSKDLMNPLSN